MRRWLVFSVLTVYAHFLLAIALSMTVGMRNDGLGLFGLARELMTLDLGEFFAKLHSLEYIAVPIVVVLSIIPFLTPRLRRFERAAIIFALACLILPITIEAISGGSLWGALVAIVALPFCAPFVTLAMLVGGLDGEFYNEGFLLLAAGGWWLLVWGTVASKRFCKQKWTSAKAVA